MRWVVLTMLGACGFAPSASSSNGGSDDAKLGSDADAPDGKLPPAGTPVRLIDLDDAKITGGPHADFPLLVAVSAPWMRDVAHGGDVARADGFDISFSSDQAGASRLSHELEAYAADTGTLTAWVKIPSLTPQTVLYIHYGDATVTATQENVHAVWSSYGLVMHLETSAVDSSGNTNSFVQQNVGGGTGKLDRAAMFDGTTSAIDAGSPAAVDDIFSGGGTADGWFYATSFGEVGYGRLFDKNQDNGWGLYLANVGGVASQALSFRHGSSGGSLGSWFTPDQSVTLNNWHHAAVVYNQDSAGNEPRLYLDGIAMSINQIDQPSDPMDTDAAANVVVGNRTNSDRTFAGLLDEMRLSTLPRSPEWIATQVRDETDPVAFYTISAPL